MGDRQPRFSWNVVEPVVPDIMDQWQRDSKDVHVLVSALRLGLPMWTEA